MANITFKASREGRQRHYYLYFLFRVQIIFNLAFDAAFLTLFSKFYETYL